MKYICHAPGKKSCEIIARDSKVISPSLTRAYSFVLNKARGCYLYDVDGKKYLDFAAGVAVANIGHNNFWVKRAIRKQLRYATHVGFSDYYSEVPVKFAEYLLTLTPNNLQKVFLSNSGTESIEAGYKLARWHTKKKYVIAFKNAFHGRTMGSLSMTCSKPVQRERYGPFLPVKHVDYAYCFRCPFGKTQDSCSFECLHALERQVKKLSKNLAAVFIEPIQGEGGYIVPPKRFIQGVRKICNDYNILLCSDEVQSGSFRTGKFLAMENFNVKADIVCLSKAIGGGIPLGATLASNKIMDWVHGSHANTFGGNLLACAAGLESLKYMERKHLGHNAVKVGDHIKKRLLELKEKYPIIGDVRGIGLMIGVELVNEKNQPEPDKRQQILCNAADNGLILLPAGKSVIRMCPPLILTTRQADIGLHKFEESLKVV